MHQRRTVIASLAALVGAATLPRTVQAADAWSIATEYPATAIPGEGISTFAEAAARLTKGALAVTPRFDAPDGLRSATMPQAVAEGRIEAADAFTGALGGLAPIFQLSALPFLTRSSADTARLLAVARRQYEAALGDLGLVLLYATPWPPSGLWSRKAVPDEAALRGLRVRTYDDASTEVFRAAGAEPSKISFADAKLRLADGTLDAVLSSGDGGAGARLWEALPHFTVLNYAFPLSLAFCGKKGLAALPEAARQGVIEAGRETEARQFKAMDTRLAANEARMRENKVQIAEAPALQEALAKAAAPVIAAWLTKAGPEGKAVLDAFQAGKT